MTERLSPLPTRTKKHPQGLSAAGAFLYWKNIRGRLSLFPACQQGLDLLDGVDDAGNGHIVVQGHDKVSGVLGDVNIDVPVAGQQLRHPVGQVGAGDVVQSAVGHSLVELLEAAGEEREGRWRWR